MWVRPERDNWLKVLAVLETIGLDKEGLDFYRNVDLNEPQVIMFDPPPIKVDILTKISLVEYSAAKAQAVLRKLNGMPVHVLHLEHLVLSKFNTGRLKDAADIEELQRIEQARKNLEG